MMAPGTDVVLGSLDTLVPLVVAAFGVGVIAGAITMGLLALRFRRAERMAVREAAATLRRRGETKRQDGNWLAANECENCAQVVEGFADAGSGRGAR